MKNFTKLFLVFTLIMGLSLPGQSANVKKDKKVIVAYVTSWSSGMPDPTYVTHINYAFGHVNDNFDGVRINNPDRLKDITALKKKNPHLKVMLSIGGWGSGRFSEMAADENYREKFSKDCQRVVKEFNLDGIDIDWEYPTSSAAKISSSPDDTENFTLLMQDIRKAIGKKKLLTLASAANGKYIDFVAINPVVDFVNIMTYDSGNPPFHHAALFRSELTGGTSCDEAVALHVAAGMPINKLVLGMPFYGRGNNKEVPGFTHYKDLMKIEGLTSKWDDVAKAPYLVNSDGSFVCSFETPESIALKSDFIKDKGLMGAMYWEYAGDTEDGALRKAVFNGVIASN